MGRLRDLVVLSGFSGAGKSSAMNVFDDAGYFCVDNLPAGMIRSLAQLFLHDGSKVERACVVSDLRARGAQRLAIGGGSRIQPAHVGPPVQIGPPALGQGSRLFQRRC